MISKCQSKEKLQQHDHNVNYNLHSENNSNNNNVNRDETDEKQESLSQLAGQDLIQAYQETRGMNLEAAVDEESDSNSDSSKTSKFSSVATSRWNQSPSIHTFNTPNVHERKKSNNSGSNNRHMASMSPWSPAVSSMISQPGNWNVNGNNNND